MQTDNRGRKRNRKNKDRFTTGMQKKLVVMVIIILLAFAGLSVRLIVIGKDNKDTYQKKILSQQRYDSSTLPFKRGSITDANGTILAVSEKVYNVILDCKVMLSNKESREPTLKALVECFGLDSTELKQYVDENPKAQYHVLRKRLTYEEISGFLEMQNANAKIKGVWFENEYIRRYPNNTMACDLIGFTGTDNNGTYGLEEYYNNELNGTNGREYGYLNDDATLERTTVAAVDGNSLVSTIDANIQSIVEKYLRQFNEERKDKAREGLGSKNTGCIIMNPNTGEILAMASYPDYDLNNPKDLTAYYSEEDIAKMQEEETYYDALNALWRNFCISDSYEPGSTAKPFTVAAGLEAGMIKGDETYECTGMLEVSDRKINCNLRSGHGVLDVSGALEQSCNVALMHMGEAIGAAGMLKFQSIFNFGLKTNIDLAGEARTDAVVFNEDTMGVTELATSSFGQGYNVTMVEMITAFSSLINGGYYYEPHVVSKITNSSGDTVKNIEPRVLKQTVSATTSAQLIEYMNAVVSEGTGKTARPAGYAIGGKTGTAEKSPRDKKNYVVSFIGYAPAENPQIAIYVVIDEPNEESQPHAYYATGIVKNILTEVLPYLHIGMTEEMTVAEQAEVDAVLGGTVQTTNDTVAEEEQNGEDTSVEQGDTQEEIQGPINVVDPVTGELIDAITGLPAETNDSYVGEIMGEASTENPAEGNTTE